MLNKILQSQITQIVQENQTFTFISPKNQRTQIMDKGIIGPVKCSQNLASTSADHSGWTDTPSGKTCKEKVEQSGTKESNEPTSAEIYDDKKNNKLTDVIESFNKTNRTESLLEIHQKSRKRKAEEENKPEERREFDRETDLLINSLDEDKKKQIIERSQELNSRFSHGQSSHFL